MTFVYSCVPCEALPYRSKSGCLSRYFNNKTQTTLSKHRTWLKIKQQVTLKPHKTNILNSPLWITIKTPWIYLFSLSAQIFCFTFICTFHHLHHKRQYTEPPLKKSKKREKQQKKSIEHINYVNKIVSLQLYLEHRERVSTMTLNRST